MGSRIIDSSIEQWKKYPIKPSHINTKEHFWDAFGNVETEASALFIVRLCQEKGGWLPFTKEELDRISKEDYRFNRLRNSEDGEGAGDLVILGSDNQYRVTHKFIATCFRSSPNL
jgi:hypothetical protein